MGMKRIGRPRTVAGMIAVMAALSAAPVIAADSAFTEACQVCHGPDGVARWPDIPNISGLPEVVIANALYDACGIRIETMPITAEKVLAALKAKDGGSA